MKTQEEIQEHIDKLEAYTTKLNRDWDHQKWWSLLIGKKIVFGLIEINRYQIDILKWTLNGSSEKICQNIAGDKQDAADRVREGNNR